MATYTIAEVPDVSVSVRGKDSPVIRQKALDKIAEMSESGELLIELPNDLNTEQLILTESTTTVDVESDEEQPLEMAIRELQKFLFLKLRTQRLKQSATTARQSMAEILSEETIEQDLDQVEEALKGNFKTLRDFVSVLREYRQGKPKAESALTILDEALGFNLSNEDTGDRTTATEPEVLTSEVDEDATKAEIVDVTAKNGNKRKL